MGLATALASEVSGGDGGEGQLGGKDGRERGRK
jgi:hypothetical protein